VRANDDIVTVKLATKEVARHRRCWLVREDIENQKAFGCA
jgi:hypothetical protein